MSLCRKTNINAPLMHEVLNKDVTKSEILPHSPATKHGYPQKKVTWREFFQYTLYKLKASSLRHIMRKK